MPKWPIYSKYMLTVKKKIPSNHKTVRNLELILIYKLLIWSRTNTVPLLTTFALSFGFKIMVVENLALKILAVSLSFIKIRLVVKIIEVWNNILNIFFKK